MGLLTLLPVLGFALLFARRLGTTHSASLLHAVSAIVLVLYLGGLAGLLWWAALVIHVLGVGLLGHEIWLLSRAQDRFQFSMPIAVLILGSVFIALVHGASLYFYYDEYAHWGIYTKEMLALDAFWGADTNSMHPRYPPAAPLWQYLFNVFRAPSEGTAYLAQFVLLLTPLLVLWERLGWRQLPWAVLIVALGLLALTNFGLGVSSLYVDHVIGAWFVGTILCYALESPDLRRSIIYCLPLTVIALTKESSLLFALATAGILGLLAWLRSWRESRRLIPGAVRGLLAGVIVMLPALVCLAVWQWRLDRIGATADIDAVGGIVAGLTGAGEQLDPEQGAEITRRFLEVLSDQQLSNDSTSRQFNAFSYSLRDLFTERYRLSTLGFFVVFTIWWAGLLSFFIRGRARWQWGIVAAGMALTGVAYILALYLTYRYAAGEYGLVLSSYTRYVHTVVLPMLIVSFAPLLPAFRDFAAERSWTIAGRRLPLPSVLAVIGCIGLYIFENPYLRPVYERNSVVGIRQQLEPVATAIGSAAGRSSIWVYLPNDSPNGFVGRLLQYLLAPTPASVERAAEFLQRDADEIFADWARFDYVWFAAELEPATAGRLAEITGQPLTERFLAVHTDAAGKTSLLPVQDESAGASP